MKKLIALLFLAWATAFAGTYTVNYKATLAATATAVTVQQPATGAKLVRFASAAIYCSADCDVTLERNGTAATTTTATVTPLNSVDPTATATAFTVSNVGTGTAIAGYTVSAGGTMTLDLSKLILAGIGTGKNVSVRIASMTGTVRVVIGWTETVN